MDKLPWISKIPLQGNDMSTISKINKITGPVVIHTNHVKRPLKGEHSTKSTLIYESQFRHLCCCQLKAYLVLKASSFETIVIFLIPVNHAKTFSPLLLITEGIWITDTRNLYNGPESRLWMGSNVLRPNYLKSRQIAAIFSKKNIWIPAKRHC